MGNKRRREIKYSETAQQTSLAGRKAYIRATIGIKYAEIHDINLWVST